jgi:hypothetical protein
MDGLPQVEELTTNQLARFKLESELATTASTLATLQAGGVFMTPADEEELKMLRVKVVNISTELERTGGCFVVLFCFWRDVGGVLVLISCKHA